MEMTTTMDAVNSGAIFAAFAGAAVAIYVIFLALSIMMIVANCKIYAKMGEGWWAPFVPFYNLWVWFKCVMGSGWKMFLTLIPIFGCIYAIIASVKFYKSFGKSTGFAILGLFFAPICLLICAFDNSTYIGPQ